MFKRSSRLIPLALVSLLAASSLTLAACGSSDEEPDREASGGKTQAWSESIGNSFGDLRGIEVDFVNSYRYKKKPIEVGVAGYGKSCPDNPDGDNPCYTREGGMSPRAIPSNEYGKWESYNGEVLFSVDANRLGKFESTITWPDPEEREGGGILGRLNFSITNPTIGKPKFTIQSGAGNECFLEYGNRDRVVALGENKSQTLTDDDTFCQLNLKITRLGDSKQFKRFTIEAL